MNPPPTTTTTLTTSPPPPLGLAVLTATVWTHRVNHFKRLPDPVWQIASDHSVPFPNLWLTINNKQNPRPSNCINSDTAWWETVSWMGDDLRFTAWNLLILSNWLSPVRKSSSLHQSPPPLHSLSTSSATINIISAGGGRWILAALLPWEAHQRPLPFLLWAEFHTLDPIFLVTGVWWLKCIKNGGSATKRWWFSELSPQLKRGEGGGGGGQRTEDGWC